MKLSRLAHGQITVIEAVRVDGAAFARALTRGRGVRIARLSTSGEIVLLSEDSPIPLGGSEALRSIVEADLPRVAWIAGRSNGGRMLSVQVHTFGRHIRPDVALAFGVDEKVVEDVRVHTGQNLTPEAVCAYLGDRLLLPAEGDGQSRAIVTAGPDPSIEHSFRMHGEGVTADIVNRDERAFVTRVTFATRPARPSERRPPALLEGDLSIVDGTRAGALRGVARAELDQLIGQDDSYLAIWRRYWTLEGRRLLERRRAFGVLPYHKRERTADGDWAFVIDGDRDVRGRFGRLGEGRAIELDAMETVPADWQRLLEAEDEDGDDELSAEDAEALITTRGARTTRYTARVIDSDPRQITLSYDGDQRDKPPESGVLLLSIVGDLVRLRRQQQADDMIRSASGPMPQLGLILEGRTPTPARHRRHPPLTPKVRDAFGGTPTAAQRQAIEAAINTPDVAIIQGPPGTGKTRTLAALQIRLAELDEKGVVINGRSLLSSFQHDAVEHAAGEIEVYGLPTVKVGRKRDAAVRLDNVGRWIRQRADAVRGLVETRPAAARLDEARRLAVAVMRTPTSRADVRAKVERILELGCGQIAVERVDAVRARLDALDRVDADDGLSPETRRLYRKALWGLYDRPEAFADGGPRQALKALIRLRRSGLLNPEDDALLRRAADWHGDETPPFLSDLGALRDRLLDRLVPDPRPAHRQLADAELHRLLGHALDDWVDRITRSPDGIGEILQDYVDTLTGEPGPTRAAIARYTRVLAATCQQSTSGRMWDALGASDRVAFESVVVDEAARANPLDLLIPMSLAERRIVLVGDHRQLPHLLEPEIERDLESSVAEEEAAALKTSLFERLYDELKARQARDGIPRVVTLDRQYRMHPTLGDFISAQFYVPHGERVGSGRPASDFAHTLPEFAGRCAGWLNVPHAAGIERRDGRGSVYREAEARTLAQRLRRLMEAAPGLTFGVIAFYRAQVDAIWRAAKQVGLATDQDSRWQIAPAFRSTDTHQERLRIGTVDAFQGKEFDVVLLSMTRTSDRPAPDERARRRTYGHLMLANRLCVAMSRQRRLLLIVGDGAMVTSDDGRAAVPALSAFHDLCGGPDGRHLDA